MTLKGGHMHLNGEMCQKLMQLVPKSPTLYFPLRYEFTLSLDSLQSQRIREPPTNRKEDEGQFLARTQNSIRSYILDRTMLPWFDFQKASILEVQNKRTSDKLKFKICLEFRGIYDRKSKFLLLDHFFISSTSEQKLCASSNFIGRI